MKIPLHLIVEYAQTKPSEIERSIFEVFGPPPVELPEGKDIEALFWEWVIFEHRQVSGINFISEYVLKNPGSLDITELKKLEQVAQSNFSSEFEIIEAVPNSHLMVEDIFSGKIYKIHDRLGSSNVASRGSLLVRIAKIQNRWYFVGANPLLMPITYTTRMKRMLRQHEGGVRPSVKDAINMIIDREEHPPKPSKPIGKKQLLKRKQDLRVAYEKATRKHKVTLGFNDLLNEIFAENGKAPMDFWIKLIKKGLNEDFIFTQVKLLQDTWNYFPHKCLGGLSPVEMYELAKKETKG